MGLSIMWRSSTLASGGNKRLTKRQHWLAHYCTIMSYDYLYIFCFLFPLLAAIKYKIEVGSLKYCSNSSTFTKVIMVRATTVAHLEFSNYNRNNSCGDIFPYKLLHIHRCVFVTCHPPALWVLKWFRLEQPEVQ